MYIFAWAQRPKIRIIKLHNILISNIFMKPRLGVSINIDKLSTCCVIKINLYPYAIMLSTNRAVYFIDNVQMNLVHDTLTVVKKKNYKSFR